MKPLLQRLHKPFTMQCRLFVLAIALTLVACQPVQPVPAQAGEVTASSAVPEVTIAARDFAFDMPAEIPAGLVSITFSNEGEVNHHGFVMRLLDGVTAEQALEAMNADMEEAASDDGGETPMPFDLAFFLPDTDPGTSNQATVDLAPGKWLIVSFSMDILSADGPPVPDWAKGSVQEFTVVDSGGGTAGTAAPEADLVVTINADDFEMPAELAAGEQTLQIVNNSGADDAFAFVVKLGGDTTLEDVLAAFDALFSGEEIEELPIVSTVGGLMGHNLGGSYYTTIHLEPGNYAIISSIGGEDFPYSGLYKNFAVK